MQSLTIEKNFSLKNHNTFGIDVKASEFIAVNTVEELRTVLKENIDDNKFILGGGSNMLLTQDIDALVIHVDLKGKKVVRQDDDFVWIECMAGENWHEFVLWTLENNYGGLENLSLIPGNVGTAPIQNIGAYGVEIKDTFFSCNAINTRSLEEVSFSKEACKFDYRESVFKQELKGHFIITSVQLKLTKRNHVLHLDYGDIKTELANKSITEPTIKDVSEAVIAIRQSKLPDPKVLGNSGSFFKNPVISKEHFKIVQEQFPDVKYFVISENEVKVPAGWLIEHAGLKGYRKGDAGVHKNQALVLVNYGNASGKELLDLSKYIQKTVFDKYGIAIEAEVNVI